MTDVLFHSLWQGATLACMLAVALCFVQSPKVRYTLACGTLLAMLLAFAGTIALEFRTPGNPLRFPTLGLEFPATTAVPGAMKGLPLLSVVQFWLLGVTLVYLYRIWGWAALRQLRSRGVCACPLLWQARLDVLASRLRLARAVVLLESAMTEIPITFGALRPLVLMPIGLLAALPVEQVEAILLHELAHIRRHDYLVNLMQTLVEGLLFYHPAIWWISHVIRRERELCCDQDVVQLTGDAASYAEALASLQQFRYREPALAATGGALMSRVLRLLGRPTSSAATALPAVLFLLLAGATLSWAFYPAPQQAPAAPNATPYQRWLDEEVVYIIAPDERAAFLRLNSDAERQMFIQQFWSRRDPTPGTPLNEMREEHYRRISWANDHFGTANVAGWQSDRGKAYIRFGPPDEREEHPASATAPATDKWRYRLLQGIGANVILEFRDAGGGNYRMTTDPNAR